MVRVRRKLRARRGATMVEYALLAALIGLGLVLTIGALTVQLRATFNNITTQLAGAGPG